MIKCYKTLALQYGFGNAPDGMTPLSSHVAVVVGIKR